MPRTLCRGLLALVILSVVIMAGSFLFPFGFIPKLPSPNCGPEHRRWLGIQFNRKEDLANYLQAHEIELLSGTSVPRLDPIPPGMVVSRMDTVIDWNAMMENIKIAHRIGYTIYSITYHHPACSEYQSYTFKVTSYGLASLYGCCGI